MLAGAHADPCLCFPFNQKDPPERDSRIYLAADLLLCFHILKNRVSYDKAPVI